MRNEIEAHGTAALAAATEAVAAAIAAQYGSGPVPGRIKAHIIDGHTVASPTPRLVFWD
jgi:hypothetical protein